MGEPTDDQRAAGDFQLGFACLLCGEEVADGAQDACDLTVTTQAGVASFTAHVGCLRSAAHEPDVFPDLVTRDKAPAGAAGFSDEQVQAWAALDEVLAEIQQAERGPDETRKATEELRKISARLYEA